MKLTPARTHALHALHAARKGRRVNPKPPAVLMRQLRARINQSGLKPSAREIGGDPRTIKRWITGVDHPAPEHLEMLQVWIKGRAHGV